MNRRSFSALAASLLSTPVAALADKLTKANLGVQLYTVRNVIASDPVGVLKKIRDTGYTEIEATLDTLTKAWTALEASGLKRTSVHMNLDPTDKELADVKAKGFEYAVIPFIRPEQREGANVQMFKKFAAAFQQAGKRARDNGLQLCYHSHSFEFEPMGGTTPLEILLTETQPDVLKFEPDMFWAVVAGQDPVKLLGALAGRVPLLHLKDKAKGIPAGVQYTTTVPPEAFKEVGSGTIDFAAILKAGDAAGVKHYIVEQDQTPDPIASIRQSYAYLSKQFGR